MGLERHAYTIVNHMGCDKMGLCIFRVRCSRRIRRIKEIWICMLFCRLESSFLPFTYFITLFAWRVSHLISSQSPVTLAFSFYKELSMSGVSILFGNPVGWASLSEVKGYIEITLRL